MEEKERIQLELSPRMEEISAGLSRRMRLGGADFLPISLDEGESVESLENVIRNLDGIILRIKYTSSSRSKGGWFELGALIHPVELFLDGSQEATSEAKIESIRRWMGDLLQNSDLNATLLKIIDYLKKEKNEEEGGVVMLSPKSDEVDFKLNPASSAQFWQTINLMRDTIYSRLAEHAISLVVPIEGTENYRQASSSAPDIFSIRGMI